MTVDLATTRRIARLARIALQENEVPKMQEEINAMLGFVAELSAVNVDGVAPMTSVLPMAMKKRKDVITEGDNAIAITRNAAMREDTFFVVPKVVE